MALTLEQALALFSLSEESTLHDLRVRFRQLAQQNHPDHQIKKQHLELAHNNMIRINEARQLLESVWQRYGSFRISTRQTNLKQEHKPSQESPDSSQSEAPHINPMAAEIAKLTGRFLHYREKAKECLHHYYYYNLDQTPLKHAGRAFRHNQEFRILIREANDGLRRLVVKTNQLAKKTKQEQFMDLFYSFTIGHVFYNTFANAADCSQSMNLSMPGKDKMVFLEYLQASKLIDKALRELFMAPLQGQPLRRHLVEQPLIAATQAFRQLMYHHKQSIWYKEINIKGQLVLASLDYYKEFY